MRHFLMLLLVVSFLIVSLPAFAGRGGGAIWGNYYEESSSYSPPSYGYGPAYGSGPGYYGGGYSYGPRYGMWGPGGYLTPTLPTQRRLNAARYRYGW
ncbi:MAG: hypothetical protein IT292_04815 [Deltaproteobacteria bacterium]|nr:hypothetical protein [Deltaproteobacteria bacterium]